jgi:hypothetical protein
LLGTYAYAIMSVFARMLATFTNSVQVLFTS